MRNHEHHLRSHGFTPDHCCFEEYNFHVINITLFELKCMTISKLRYETNKREGERERETKYYLYIKNMKFFEYFIVFS